LLSQLYNCVIIPQKTCTQLATPLGKLYASGMTTQNDFNPTRKLVNLPKLLEKYKIKKLNVAYHDPDKPKTPHITIPPNVNLFVMLKVWIAYDTNRNEIYVSKNLIGVDNFWLTQILDDEKYKRLNITKYLYE